jgi:fructose-specific component phosphotransferase system IIB-like protein
MPAVILGMGGLAMGASLLQGLGASSQAQAQAKQQQMAAENANFQRQWQVDANNRAIEKANLARALNNMAIERTALNERAIAEVYQKMGYDNAKSQYSKQTNQVNSALLSSISGRNISASSGTARALLRQNLFNATANMANLRISNTNKMRDIATVYQNRLAQRDFNFQEFNTFIPGDTSTVSGAPMGAIIGSAALSGIGSGLSAGLSYGAQGKGLFAT